MLEEIENKLKKNLIKPKQLTSNFKFIDNNSKKAIKYNDDLYIPFFYYLGQHIHPTRVFELGANLAFLSSIFFKSCKSAKYYLGFQQKYNDFFNYNIPRSNLTINYKGLYDFYYGNLFDEDFLQLYSGKFELIIINQEYNYDTLFEITENIYLNKLSKEGFLVFSDLSKKNIFDIFLNITKGYKTQYKIFQNKIGVIIK